MSNATVVRVRSTTTGTDSLGDPITTEARVTLADCIVAPRSGFAGSSSGDITERARQGVIVGLSLYAPFDADVVHTDQLEVDGVLYEVDGEAGRWKQPWSGWEAGCEIALKRAAG